MKKVLNKITRRKFINNSAKATLFSSFGIVGFPTIVPSSVFGKDSPSEKINIGQIGFGRVAMSHDLAETLKYNSVRVVAVADFDSFRVKKGKQFIDYYYEKRNGKQGYVNTKTYSDYREIINDRNIDAVIISTPDHWHVQPAIEAALAGKDIYLQKPTSLTVKEGRLLSDIVKEKKVILQIGTQQRSMAQFRIAAELVRNGRIGKLETVKIGLPGYSSDYQAPEMPVPGNLNYDGWLGSTPERYYSENTVHPRQDITGRPGWMNCEQFGAGIITDWGQHHFDSAAWGMDTELTGPVSIEAVAQFSGNNLCYVHGNFMAKTEYKNGVTVLTSSGYKNGIRYEGSEGWIFVTRGNNILSAGTEVTNCNRPELLVASNPKILTSEILDNEIHLPVSDEQHGNWLDSIRSRRDPVSPVEIGHRSCSVALIIHIAMKLGRKLTWDPDNEIFINDKEANSMLSRTQRFPYGADYIQI